MTVTGGVVHGWSTAIYIPQETLSHGSNACVEVMCQLLDEVSSLCRVYGRRVLVHLVRQADNTVAQTKNQYAASFCSQLVGVGKFCTVTMICSSWWATPMRALTNSSLCFVRTSFADIAGER